MASIDDVSDPPLGASASAVTSGGDTARMSRSETVKDLVMVVVWVAMSDWLLYQSGGYAAWAAFLILSALTLAIAKGSLGAKWLSIALMLFLLACSARLAWCGSGLAVASGIGLLCCLSMTLHGLPPYLTDMLQFLGGVIIGAGSRVAGFRLRSPSVATTPGESSLRWLLPVGLVLLFSAIFVQANPDLSQLVGRQLTTVAERAGEWLMRLDGMEILFWIMSAWLVLGLAYPATTRVLQAREGVRREAVPYTGYKAVRNSLLSVIALFAVYLVFEFMTLWFREFPKGFYYAGYAHEGAAWLTVALALATLLLSIFFRRSTLLDPRVSRLKILAWIWSAENFLLAIAVYNRMAIYIDFNGMTRMRVVGIFGITAVAVGFAWVIVKIARQRDFLWLLRYQLWTVACAVVLYAILPVDYFVHRYNADQILSGKLAPSVQIPTHETSAEGVLPLVALVHTQDPIIRDGIRATLADWYDKAILSEPTTRDWRNQQWVNRELRRRLEQVRSTWEPFLQNERTREQALQAFHAYAYQWY